MAPPTMERSRACSGGRTSTRLRWERSLCVAPGSTTSCPCSRLGSRDSSGLMLQGQRRAIPAQPPISGRCAAIVQCLPPGSSGGGGASSSSSTSSGGAYGSQLSQQQQHRSGHNWTVRASASATSQGRSVQLTGPSLESLTDLLSRFSATSSRISISISTGSGGSDGGDEGFGPADDESPSAPTLEVDDATLLRLLQPSSSLDDGHDGSEGASPSSSLLQRHRRQQEQELTAVRALEESAAMSCWTLLYSELGLDDWEVDVVAADLNEDNAELLLQWVAILRSIGITDAAQLKYCLCIGGDMWKGLTQEWAYEAPVKVQWLQGLGMGPREVLGTIGKCPRLLSAPLDAQLKAAAAWLRCNVTQHAQGSPLWRVVWEGPEVLCAPVEGMLQPNMQWLVERLGRQSAARLAATAPAALLPPPPRLQQTLAETAAVLAVPEHAVLELWSRRPTAVLVDVTTDDQAQKLALLRSVLGRPPSVVLECPEYLTASLFYEVGPRVMFLNEYCKGSSTVAGASSGNDLSAFPLAALTDASDRAFLREVVSERLDAEVARGSTGGRHGRSRLDIYQAFATRCQEVYCWKAANASGGAGSTASCITGVSSNSN